MTIRAGTGPLRAGVGRRDITPRLGSPAGLSLTTPTAEIWDQLSATVLVLESGRVRAALVCTDLVGILGSVHDEIRSAVAGATGAHPDHVIVNASHTHSAPYVSADLQALLRPHALRIVDDAYPRHLVDQVAQAAAEAVERAEPVRLHFGRATIGRVASNRRPRLPDGNVVHRYGRPPAWMRRLPEGRIDPAVSVLALAGLHGTVAILASYACHPTAAGGDNHPHVSADFVGAGRTMVEDAVAAPVLFLQGCAGDIGTGKWVGRGRRADTRALGGRFGRGVLRGLREARLVDGVGLVAASQRITLRFDRFPPSSELETALSLAVRDRDAARIVAIGDQLVVARRLAEGRRPIVKALRIGDVALVALPGEVFLELGESIARRSQFAATMVTAYDDNSIQYVPTAEAFDDGEYEVTGGWRYIRRGEGERLADAAVRLLQRLAS